MKYTKYEIARLVGARALQLSLGAPLLLKFSEKELEEMRYDVVKIATKEVEADVISFTIKRTMPVPEAPLVRKNVLLESVEGDDGVVAALPPMEDDGAE